MPGFSAAPAPWGAIGQLLLLAVGLLLVGGFARSPYDERRLGRMPKHTQLPQTLLLLLLALMMWFAAARDTSWSALGLLIALGVGFGFLGDLFMANAFNQKDHVLYGMAAFATGHIFYLLGFRQIALALALHAPGSYLFSLALLGIVAVVMWFLLVRDPAGNRVMQFAALVYALFLAGMAAYALGLALQQAAFWPLATGGMLFLVSDGLIAARLFGGRRFAYLGDVIWTTYIIAQALIVTAVPVALAL